MVWLPDSDNEFDMFRRLDIKSVFDGWMDGRKTNRHVTSYDSLVSTVIIV